jgi:hypothetical protein
MATIAKRDGGEKLDLDIELYPEAGRWVNLRSKPRLQNYILLTTAALRMKGQNPGPTAQSQSRLQKHK